MLWLLQLWLLLLLLLMMLMMVSDYEFQVGSTQQRARECANCSGTRHA